MTSRIDALMAQMTIEEKVGQLNVTADMVRPFVPDINPVANEQNAGQVLELIRQGKVGALFNGRGRQGAVALQRVAVEESRLGIPLILAADVIHGMARCFRSRWARPRPSNRTWRAGLPAPPPWKRPPQRFTGRSHRPLT